MFSYQKIVDLRNMYLIKKSGYFDDRYYKSEYPEVHGNRLKHYYYEGWKQGYNPSDKFDNDYYLSHNTDVGSAGINPLLHYVVSGKNEGRHIMKVNGTKISTIYSILSHHKYAYVSFLENSCKKRVTIFFKNEENLNDLLEIIHHCNKNNMPIRIIYNKINFAKFYQFIDKEHIDMTYIQLVKWSSNYYLNVYINEKIICFDYQVLNSLLNTPYISVPIYYFITNDNLKDSVQNMWLSYYIEKGSVVLIGNKKIKTNTYQLIVEKNIERVDKDIIKIGFKFDKLSIPMLKLYQEYFIYKDELKKFEFEFTSSDFCKNISFDNNKKIKYQPNLNDVDILIEFSDNKAGLEHSNNNIQIYFEKTNNELKIHNINRLFYEEGDNNV